MKTVIAAGVLVAGTLVLAAGALAGAAQDGLLAAWEAEARAADPAFAGFSADRGKAFFLARHAGGKPETPSCTTCHDPDPRAPGQTRSGKPIDPMAVSVTPTRFTDLAEAEKWFGRTCRGVLGRECTAAEKGDFALYFIGQ